MNGDTQKKSNALWTMSENSCWCILICLVCTKHKEINMHFYEHKNEFSNEYVMIAFIFGLQCRIKKLDTLGAMAGKL